MLPYILILLSLAIAAFIEIVTQNRKLSVLGLIFFTILFFVLSFIRWETGTDWDTYYEMYTWIKVPWATMGGGMELGFSFISNLGFVLFDSYTGVLFLFALILYICTYRSTIYFSKYPITTLLFSYCLTFAGMLFVRQNVAVAMLLVALIYADKRQFWWFLLWVFLASLIHRTAWVFLLIYPIYYRYYKMSTLIIVLMISVIVSLGLSKVLLSFIGNLGLGAVSMRVENYLELGTDESTMAISTTAVLIKGMLNRVFLTGFIFLFFNNQRKENPLLNGLVNIYILGTVLYCMTLPLSISLARIAVYMDMVQIFIIPLLLSTQTKLSNRTLMFGIMLLYYVVRFYMMFISYEFEYVPFTTIFD